MRARMAARHAGRDVDVAHDGTALIDRCEAERDHIRRSLVSEMLAVERGDPAICHEGDRQQRVAHALAAQHPLGERRDTGPRDRDAHPFGGDVDGDAHTVAGSDRTGALGYSTRAWYMPPSTRANSRFTMDSCLSVIGASRSCPWSRRCCTTRSITSRMRSGVGSTSVRAIASTPSASITTAVSALCGIGPWYTNSDGLGTVPSGSRARSMK